jgi:hypothetical protein
MGTNMLGKGGGADISEYVTWVAQDNRRFEYSTDEDRAEAVRQKLPFSRDKEEGPPLAWVIMWRGTYSNSYGDVIPDSLKAWGYIFWDANRLVKSGAKDSLLRVWTPTWP